MNQRELDAIAAVAREFSAQVDRAKGTASASLLVAGKRVAVEVRALRRSDAGRKNAAKPGLRFDKVATRVVSRLQGALSEAVPDGTTVVLTVTAPILLPAKTAVALEATVREVVARGEPGRAVTGAIHGNGFVVRVLRSASSRSPKLIGFVHNPDTDPIALIDMTRAWLELAGDPSWKPTPKIPGERWLAVTSHEKYAYLEAFRYIYSQLHLPSDYARALVAFSDGRVGSLKD
jgi:hypothetical protein